FIILRPSDILSSAEGPRVLEALGPTFKSMRENWERAAGVAWTDVEQLIISLYPNGSDFPRAACVVHLGSEIAPGDLVAKWQGATEAKEGDATIYNGPEWSYYVPSKESGKIFVMANVAELKEVIERKAAPPLMRREVEKLRKISDRDRHFTMLFNP